VIGFINKLEHDAGVFSFVGQAESGLAKRPSGSHLNILLLY
jgi:hypothetical protein